LDNLQSKSFSQVSSIKTFDFSSLYTTLPHDKLKTRLKEPIHKVFSYIVAVIFLEEKPELPEETTNLSQVTDKLYHIMLD
jgi:hypothetical protein